MYKLDGKQLELAEEFKSKPFGPYSRELERLLLRMRQAPAAGRPILINTVRHKEWRLAKLSGIRGEKPIYINKRIYTNVAEAEWDVFVQRWLQLTGENLENIIDAPKYSESNLPSRR
ncbi:hypothetical protein [Dasania marina]|uniref:hypothetical protein n=1 Tax=Dasania marina TaxID=471499 RepID=UPI00035DC7BB|nr:hypothetical protein [Dasania marina]